MTREEYAEHLASTWTAHVLAEGHSLDDLDAMIARMIELDEAARWWLWDQCQRRRSVRARRGQGYALDCTGDAPDLAAEALVDALIRGIYADCRAELATGDGKDGA